MVKRNRKIAAGEDNDEDEKKSSAINTRPSANRNPKKRKVEVENAMEVETSHTGSKEPFVYYGIFHNEQMSRITRIKVKDHDYIDSIIDEIKIKERPDFDNIASYRIELFESKKHKKPLDAVVKWNSNVKWGTKTHPLIVKVKSPMVTVAPVNTGSSAAAVVGTDIYAIQSPWDYNQTRYQKQIEKGQAFIKSIMENYEPIPDVDGMKNDTPATNDMKVLQKVIDLETGTIGNVVLRSITESFWQKVIEATNTRRVCALGTPGIGKSTTTCILIRMLLQQNKTVVYRLRKLDAMGFVYMFVPRMDSMGEVVNVRVIREYEFDYIDTNVNQADIYYVVDPGQTIDNCNLSSDFEGKVIIVASPDNRHWGESDFEKSRRNISGEFLFFPVWTLSELLCAKKYFDYCFGEEEDDKEIICRYEKVGGVPRNIFTDKNKFSDILVCQKTALNNVDESQLRKLTSNDKDAAVTSEKDQQKSLVMVYEGSSDKNFKHFSIGVSSKFVMSKLIQKNAVFMWNQMVSLSVEHGGYGWKIFESYCQEILLGKPKEYSYCKYHNGTGLVTLGKKLKLGGCTAIKGTRGNLITTATDTAATNNKTNNNDQTLYYSFHPNHVFIDFIYKKKDTIYAFQVTLADNHSCDPKYLEKFAKEAGGPSKFVMHYLSYDAKYDKFKLKPKNPLRKLEGHDWTIYLVCIPRPDEIVTKR